ncbi:MAG: hypothetical protein OEZ34_09275 [Spirochaetia bacterium]|nr:hypothetical protein [Spirochaetia bacterium]
MDKHLEKRKKLIDEIIKAFDGVEQPAQITLHVAEAHDLYDYDNDAEHRKKDFIGLWQGVPSSHIKACQSALSYVDRVGMRYYLPAYMVWYLKNWGNTEEVRSDQVLYELDNNPGDESLEQYHKERFSLFDKQQLRASALFVQYCAEDPTEFSDADFAKVKLERYWCRFLNAE